MFSVIAKRALQVACAATLAFVPSMHAQYFPTFGSFTQTSVPTFGGVPQGLATTTVPLISQPSGVMAAFNTGILTFGKALDGLNFSQDNAAIDVQEYCDAQANLGHCTPAITTMNGSPYVAFRDSNSHLRVFRGDRIFDPNNGGAPTDYFNWTSVLDTTITNGMSTSPSITVFAGAIRIFYGYDRNFLEEAYSTDGVNWNFIRSTLGASSRQDAAPTQMGLAVLNGTLFMTAQQNNSNRNLYYWTTTDGINFQQFHNDNYQVADGITMVNFNNNLIFASKQNNNQNHIFLFSSPDGFNWFDQQQSQVLGTDRVPALTVFNGQVQMTYVDSNLNLITALGQ